MSFDKVQLTKTEEMRALSEYAGKKTQNMQKQEEECENMGACSRWWDSKVPETEKAFFNRVNLTTTSKELLLHKAKTYREFYEEINTLVSKLKSSGEVNCQELRQKIHKLKKKLSETYQTAKREELETSSKKVRDMHRSFIREYDRLDCVVKDFENSALCDMLTSAQNGWKKALEEIADLKEQLSDISNKYEDVCDKLDSLNEENKKAAEKQDALFMQNKEMAEKMDQMMDLIKRLFP